MRRIHLAFASGVLFAIGALADAGPSRAAGNDALEHATLASEYTTAFEFDAAHKELAEADADSPYVVIAKGRLAIYEGDCDLALSVIARPDVAKTEQGESLADIARGCARATAATVVEKDDANGIEIRYQDELDRALTPLLVETVVKARDALTRDLGVTWPRPTRITVVRDLLSLSAMTGLSYKAAQTTGTVAVAKWGRVTLLSPRASHHGYPWRDTVAHELTHLAVTRATVDRAPLWLQEGLAKRHEIRWRDPGAFDDRPPVDAVVARGVDLKLDLPLDKLGPSIAILPNPDAAMVAFAEVTSFVRFLAETASPDALPRLLLGLREKKPIDVALAESSGADLKTWDTRWRANLVKKPHEPLSALYGLGQAPPGLTSLRERTRLGELLLGRDHPAEALVELDKIPASMLGDPSLRYVRLRALEAAGRLKDTEPLAADPKDVIAAYGRWWAIRGRFARSRGDSPLGDASFVEAVANDPLDFECACETLDAKAAPDRPLCKAALERNEPGLGRD